ncbi:MAG: imidazole glycerol phosphate synthase subunit HisH [Myxococcales bacterium]|nr:imidazole glycerol phosphate synthase subunit HisH [Myxococcales bacterium]
MQLTVIDTGLGNLRSVEKAIVAAGSQAGRGELSVLRTADPERVRRADRLVFPGQGAFRDCMRGLAGGLGEALAERLHAGTPYLGICLGLQVLFEASDEAPGVPGLGLYSGHVERLSGRGVKIPHMGWNQLELVGSGHPFLEAAGGEGTWVYYVHSFAAVPVDESVVVAVSQHGDNSVTAAIAKDNVFAVQFHPEKSQDAGLQLLAAFLRT